MSSDLVATQVFDFPERRHRTRTLFLGRQPASLRYTPCFGLPQKMSVSIVDVSDAGARLETDKPLHVGQSVVLALPPDVAASLLLDNSHVAGCVTRVTELGSRGECRHVTGIEFVRSIGGRLQYMVDRAIPWLVLAFMLVVLAALIALKKDNVYYFWYHPLFNSYGLLVSVFIVSRLAIAAFYRPPVLAGYTPSVSVVVACKNEERSIYRTVERIYASDYPHDKMQVICVDDGSTDGTLDEMKRARSAFPGLEIIHFARNRGKRHGMAAGAYRARGDVLVYVDSDSFVRRDAIRQIVAPFADPSIGAVCGHAHVENAGVNWLTKMQEVRYYLAFRVVKAAESVFSAVTCCSGCLAAYRRSFVMTFVDSWLYQRFLGSETTFGDDRSMTNRILRHWRVVYNSEAVCSTIVPETWSVFLRQQVRWKKSWIRETLLSMRFIWRKHPLASASVYFGFVVQMVAPLIVSSALILPLFGAGAFSYLYLCGVTLMAVLYSVVYAARFRSSIWGHGVLFAFVYMLGLVWQTYYALFTVRRSHWGTR